MTQVRTHLKVWVSLRSSLNFTFSCLKGSSVVWSLILCRKYIRVLCGLLMVLKWLWSEVQLRFGRINGAIIVGTLSELIWRLSAKSRSSLSRLGSSLALKENKGFGTKRSILSYLQVYTTHYFVNHHSHLCCGIVHLELIMEEGDTDSSKLWWLRRRRHKLVDDAANICVGYLLHVKKKPSYTPHEKHRISVLAHIVTQN